MKTKQKLAASAAVAAILAGVGLSSINTSANANTTNPNYISTKDTSSKVYGNQKYKNKVDMNAAWTKAHDNGNLAIVVQVPNGRTNLTQGVVNNHRVLLSSDSGKKAYTVNFNVKNQNGKTTLNSYVAVQEKINNKWVNQPAVCVNNGLKYVWASGKKTIEVLVDKKCLPGSSDRYYVSHVTLEHKPAANIAGVSDVINIKRNLDVKTAPVLVPTPNPSAGATLPGSTTEPSEKTKILLVGDSVTHGYSGDLTYRYRLWQHLTAGKLNFDFVGPYTGVRNRDMSGPFQDEKGYKVSAFDHDHAAKSGQKINGLNISHWVKQYDADVVFIALGVNDMIVDKVSPKVTADRMEQQLRTIRANGFTGDIILSAPSQQYWPGVNEYSSYLSGLATKYNTSDARVLYAPGPKEYTKTVHTWDALHPNASGEVLLGWEAAYAFYKLGYIGKPAIGKAVISATSPNKDVVTAKATPVLTADGYYLQNQPVSSCAVKPVESKYVKTSHYLKTPTFTFKTTSNYVWVRYNTYRKDVANLGAPICLKVK